VFLAALYQAEREIAEKLKALAVGRPTWPAIDVNKAIPWVEQRAKLALADSQKAALRVALVSNVMVITGGPGVGKTTLVNSLLKILTAKAVSIAFCAPTGRAARRLSESTGHEAKTIHRLLETDPRTGSFRRNEVEPLDCDLLVVDETSMVDVPLMRAVLRALPEGAALLLVGDVDQLPSVGPGQVLGDIIGSGAVPVVRLTEVFRQAAESRIIVNAHRINHGLMPDLATAESGDFYFVDAAEPEEGVRKLLAIVQERIPNRFGLNPIRDIQVLCPVNRGGLGARSLNIELQNALNPPGEIRIDRSAHQGVGVSGSIARTIAVPDSGLHHLVALHIARSKWSCHTPCQLRRERELFFVGKAKCHFRVRMNIIASSETIAVRLQKTCMLLPRRCSSAAAARSPV
jgi:exodeoxyribonuclease V alpha subunit